MSNANNPYLNKKKFIYQAKIINKIVNKNNGKTS